MKKFLLYLWQLPQTLLGLLLIVLFRAEKYYHPDTSSEYYLTKRPTDWGVSLGEIIVFGYKPSKITQSHELGHRQQSHITGWLYLLVIGLPSFCGNVFDRIFHKKWSIEDRQKWYYSQPWEADADRRGNVVRN